jgi:hypothetical protein
MPARGTQGPELVRYYADRADAIVIGASISLVSIAVFVLFAAGLRRVLVQAEDGEDLLPTAAFGGAILGWAAGIGAETTNMEAALRVREGELDPALAETLFEVSQVLGSTGAAVGLAVLLLATAAVALRTGTPFPRPVALLTGVLGLTLLTPLAHIGIYPGAVIVLFALLVAVPLLRDPARR